MWTLNDVWGVFKLFDDISTSDGFALTEGRDPTEAAASAYRVYRKGPHTVGLTWNEDDRRFVLQADNPLRELSGSPADDGTESAEHILAVLFATAPGLLDADATD